MQQFERRSRGPKRRNMMGETRFLSDWLARFYPGRSWRFQFRVGHDAAAVGVEIIDEAERRLMRNLNRYVDVLIEPPPDIVIVEATMWQASEALGKLAEYLVLLPATPEYSGWAGHPLVPVILTAQHDTVTELLAQRQGVRYVFWEPEWIGEWYAVYPERRRRAPHAGMVAELEKRLE